MNPYKSETMKRTIYILFLTLLFVSCKTKTFFQYSSSLSKVELENKSKPISDSSKSYSDDIISVSWYMMKDGFTINLYNKADYPITLDWNSVSYINENGNTSHVIHYAIMQ